MNPQQKSILNLQQKIKERESYGDKQFSKCIGFIEDKIIYHSDCYKKVTNTSSINWLKKRFDENKWKPQNENIITPTVTNPEITIDDTPSKSLRSNTKPYDKSKCIICQESCSLYLRKVEFESTGVRMLEVAKQLEDKQFFLRLNNISSAKDAVANDVKYHLTCWVNAKRKIVTSSSNEQELEDVTQVLADIEIINTVTEIIHESETIIDMNSINVTYNNLMGLSENNHHNYKRYLKKLFEEYVPDIIFSRPPARNQPEIICSANTCTKSINKSFKNSSDDFNIIFKAAKLIRNKIISQENWKFEGDFDTFSIPQELKSLLQWIIIGPRKTLDKKPQKIKEVENSVKITSQVIMSCLKTPRQVNNISSETFHQLKETPFTVGLGLHIHKKTRNKTLIDMLSNFNLCISYKKVLQIENIIAEKISDGMKEQDGVYIPATIKAGKRLHFAIDNLDFKNDTPDGRNEFHGTTTVVFQKDIYPESTSTFFIDRSKYKGEESVRCVKTFQKHKPVPIKERFPQFSNNLKCSEMEIFKKRDYMWAICQVLEEPIKGLLPTWSAYNSLVTNSQKITTCQGIPLYPASPTDWSSLYTSLKIVQGINVSVTNSRKTIVTLDLQLYSKCMQMRDDKDIFDNFIFRLGELHVVFAMLKVLGKMINGSGIERLFIESNIYGETTLKQILEGKHMRRGIEAHTIMYLALSRLCIKKCFIENTTLDELTKQIKQHSSLIESSEDQKTIRDIDNAISDIFNENSVFSDYDTFREGLQNQGRFFVNYMKMFENLLLFIRSVRQGLWNIHLASLNDFVKYFFVHDQINYARLSPVYLATMLELENDDPNTWLYLKENFSINKRGLPFTAIGSDHALEQDNKNLKITGGIKGLLQNSSALNRYCLIAPILNLLSKEFYTTFNATTSNTKKHYQLTGSYLSRLCENTNKLLETMEEFNVSFDPCTCVFNVITNAVLPESAANELLNHQKIGKEMYNEFVVNRFNGETSIWAPLKKRNLRCFKTELTRKIQTKAEGKIITLKEENSLLTRFLIASRKRPEIDLEFCLGNYEFAVVPKSLFSADGEPLLCTDKSKVLHKIEELAKTESNQESEEELDEKKVVILDGMAVLNQINKTKSIQTCKVCRF